MGSYFWARARFKEAEKKYFEALHLRVTNNAPHYLIGTCHNNLGTVYADWANATSDANLNAERRKAAIKQYEEGLKFVRMGMGEIALNTAVACKNLALECSNTERPDLAEPLFIRAAGILATMVRAGQIDPHQPEFQDAILGLAKFLRSNDSVLSKTDCIEKAMELALTEVPAVLSAHNEWKQNAEDTEEDDRSS